jgi:hypothetical protein
MRKSLYLAAAIAFMFSDAAFANEPGAPKSGASTGSSAATSTAAAQCDSLTGAKKEQCLRQVQQSRADTATGGTSGSGAAGSSPSTAQNPATTGGAPTGTARP